MAFVGFTGINPLAKQLAWRCRGNPALCMLRPEYQHLGWLDLWALPMYLRVVRSFTQAPVNTHQWEQHFEDVDGSILDYGHDNGDLAEFGEQVMNNCD